MSTSHTPGPWRAVEWTCHDATSVLAGDRQQIAECSGFGRDTRESAIADARLIAAAPELLAVAQLLVQANCPEAVAFATQRAHAAICKAIGEAQ